MKEFYEIEIAGLKRELPICKAGENLYIGAFVMFSDVELTVKAATALLEKSPRAKTAEIHSGLHDPR